MKCLFGLLATAFALTALAVEFPYTLSCRGVTTPGAEVRVENFVYSLYDRQNVHVIPTEPLWSRRVTTTVEMNGHFTVVLSDSSGSATTPAMLDKKLVDAFALVEGVPELVVADVNGNEVVRTPMTTLRESYVAASAHAVDLVGVSDANVNVTGRIDAYELYAGMLTVGAKSTLPEKCIFVPCKERFLGGSNATELVVRDITTAREAWPSIVAAQRQSIEMKCDFVVTYDRPSGAGAYNLIVPRLTELPVPEKDVQAVAETAFGGL